MTCIPGGQANCAYPLHRCELAPNCTHTIERAKNDTGLGSPMFVYLPGVMVVVAALVCSFYFLGWI